MNKYILVIAIFSFLFGTNSLSAKIQDAWMSTGINSNGASLSSTLINDGQTLFAVVFSTKARCLPYIEIISKSPDIPDFEGVKEIEGKLTVQIDNNEEWLISSTDFTVTDGLLRYFIYPDEGLNLIDEIIAGNTLRTTFNGVPELTVPLNGSGKATKQAVQLCINSIQVKKLTTKEILKKAGFYY